MFMCPLKIEGRKPPIFADLRTENRHLLFPKSENLKLYGQSVAMWGRPYQTWWESHHPTPETGCSLGVWGGAGKL